MSRRAHTRPGIGAQIQSGHPLASRLRGAWLMNEGGGRHFWNSADPGGGAFCGVTPLWDLDQTPRFAGVTANSYKCGTLAALNLARFTVVVKAQVTGGSTNNRRLLEKSSSGIGIQSAYWLHTGGANDITWGVSPASGDITIDVAMDLGNTDKAWHTFAGSADGTTSRLYVDGVLRGSAAAGTVETGNGIFSIGQATDEQHPFVGRLEFVYVFEGALSDEEIEEVTFNPYGLFEQPPWRKYVISGADVPVVLEPGAGTLTLTGQAPGLNLGVTIPVGALALTGWAPTVSVSITVTPGVGALTLTGLAPTVAMVVAVPVGSVALTGLAPSAVTAITLTPGVGSLTLTGLAPTVAVSQTVAPGAGAVALTGRAPTLATAVAVPVGTLTVTGRAPTVSTSKTISPGVGSLALTGLAPSLVLRRTALVGVGSLALTGHEPTASVTLGDSTILYHVFGYKRFGATRFGYFPSSFKMTIGGVAYDTFAIKPSVNIVDVIDEQASTAQMTVRSKSGQQLMTPPVKGQALIIGSGNITNRIFAGRISRVARRARTIHTRFPRYDIEAVDWTTEADQVRVPGHRWTATSVSTICSDIVTTYLAAKGFTALNVLGGMASVDFEITAKESISSALTRLLKLVGGYWYWDYNQDLHAYVGSEATGNLTIANSTLTFWDLMDSSDLSQVRTRVHVFGGGGQTTAAVSVGATSIAVNDTSWYAAGGGVVLSGPNRITYTGRSTSSGPGNLTGVPGSGAGSIVYALPQGQMVQVWVTRNDLTAQAALAVIFGGSHDGIIEESIEDTSLSDAGAVFVGDGQLAAFKDPEATIEFKTRDVSARSGKKVTVNLTSPFTLSATFIIQQVTISEFGLTATHPPTRTVTAGVNKRDLFDLLAQLRT